MSDTDRQPVGSLIWKARPIFISSTFRDMHAERDHLNRWSPGAPLREVVPTRSEVAVLRRHRPADNPCLSSRTRAVSLMPGNAWR